MNTRRATQQLERLQLEIDTRILDLWHETVGVDEWTLEQVGAFMRAAYGKGFADAMTEARPERFFHDHGYAAPKRRRK